MAVTGTEKMALDEQRLIDSGAVRVRSQTDTEAWHAAAEKKVAALGPTRKDYVAEYNATPEGQALAASTSNSNNAPGAKIQESKDTYTDQQPTEQVTAAANNKSKAPSSSAETSTPTNIEGVGTPPPTEITDVVNDFDWTSSINKQQMAGKIPYIRLTEFKLTANNAVNGFAVGLMAWADVHRSSVAGASKLGGTINTVSQSNFIGKSATAAGDAIRAAGAAVAPYLQKAENFVKSKSNDSFGHEGQHLTDAFGMLYAREATGRTYTLPYYNKDYFHAGNDFSDSTENAPPLVGGFFDVIQAAGAIPSLVEPGVYVQRPKFYQFASAAEPTVNISLTLYNTLTPMSYLKHAKFIQQLALNNLPRRVTRSVVEPPCIYEVFIPGKAFYPYCFISNLKISNVGARRIINNEIVPDAFQIEISLTSLTKDASNFYDRQMQHHGIGAPSTPGAGGAASSFTGGGGNNMGSSGAQRDAVASVGSGSGGASYVATPPAAASSGSDSTGASIDRTVSSLNKSADKFESLAVQYDKAGNSQKAAEMRAESADARRQANMIRQDYDKMTR